MDYIKLTIDLIKSTFAQHIATRSKDNIAVSDGFTTLKTVIDQAIIVGEGVSVLKQLKKASKINFKLNINIA